MTVAVIGAGISGLVTALRLKQAGCRVTVFESSDRVGGKLRSARLDGMTVDMGAEAFVRRRPEVMDLAAELGLADDIVSPVGRRPAVYADGGLYPFPARQLMGIPADAHEVSVPLAWAPGSDVSLGALVRERLGDEVVGRCVDPMLGGVYSAHADDVSLRAALPALAAELDAGATSLTAAVGAVLARSTATGPVFGAFRSGYQELLDALAAQLEGAILLNAPVPELRPGWMLRGWWFDKVVLAAPPQQVARITRTSFPQLARAVGAIPAANSAIVTLVLPDTVALPDYSGVLVASRQVLTAKAFTLSTQKWGADTRPGPTVRVSLGRLGVSRILDEDDQSIIDVARADLETALGVTAVPVSAAVQRWYEGIPVYTPGHLDRLAEIEAATPPGLVLTGAYFDGVGVAACIAHAEAAAERVLERQAAG
ncbi:FAD-dependent oxidoreductase [Tsukamurella soli]